MYRVGYVLYVAALAEFLREGQDTGALLAGALLGWSLTTDLLAHRSTWTGPTVDGSGYSRALSQHDVDFLSGLDRFAFVAKFLAVGLGIFGPLLFAWSLLL